MSAGVRVNEEGVPEDEENFDEAVTHVNAAFVPTAVNDPCFPPVAVAWFQGRISGRGGSIGERRPQNPMDSMTRGSIPIQSAIIFWEFFRIKMLC